MADATKRSAAKPVAPKIPPIGIKQRFAEFAKCGEARQAAVGKTTITLPQIDKWFRQAGLFSRTLSPIDTETAFRRSRVQALDRKAFLQLVADVCKMKRLDAARVQARLTECGKPASESPIETSAATSTKTTTTTTHHRGAAASSKTPQLNITDWLMSSPKFIESMVAKQQKSLKR